MLGGQDTEVLLGGCSLSLASSSPDPHPYPGATVFPSRGWREPDPEGIKSSHHLWGPSVPCETITL